MTSDEVNKETMAFAHLSDLEMALSVRMLMRTDLDHEAVCTGARDRIMYLSQENERLRALQESNEPKPTSVERVDKGRWSVHVRAGNGVYLASDDFAHDEALTLTGYYESLGQKLEAANQLADRLNNEN